MGDEGKLYVPLELVSVYREKVTNPVKVLVVFSFIKSYPFHKMSSSKLSYLDLNEKSINKKTK